MEKVKRHLGFLGERVVDKITGFKGVVTSVSFDLYGYIQAVVDPGLDECGDKLRDSRWFDINRLRITGKKKVMDPPDFDIGPVADGKKGAAEKPPFF